MELEVKGLSIQRYNELLEKEEMLKKFSTEFYIQETAIITPSIFKGGYNKITIYSKKEFIDIVSRFIKILKTDHTNKCDLKYKIGNLTEELDSIKSKWWYKMFNKEKGSI